MDFIIKEIKDYSQMKKYYMMAIYKCNYDAMNNLGNYYKNVEKNYKQMKQFYLMAIDKCNSNAMNNLGYYYKNDKIEFYKELIKIENKNDFILNKINELEQLKQI
jgi:TPR repeat protein